MNFDTLLVESLAAAFLIGFPAMFSIVNPIGNALTFLNVTTNRTHAERVILARRIGLYSLAVLLGSIWLGDHVLSFFGISLGALRIAGGVAVTVQAWKLLMAPDQPAGRKGNSPGIGSAPREDVAFFPLTMPLTTGPGSIAVAIALGSEAAGHGDDQIWFLGGVTLAAFAIAGLVATIYAFADRITVLLGAAGERVLSRIVAFLLLCIGVQMLWTGIDNLLRPTLIATIGMQ